MIIPRDLRILAHGRCKIDRVFRICLSDGSSHAGTQNKAPNSSNLSSGLQKQKPVQPGHQPESPSGKLPSDENQTLSAWPDGVNPDTGERGGPLGPEPTRYGDWERKGRVSDF